MRINNHTGGRAMASRLEKLSKFVDAFETKLRDRGEVSVKIGNHHYGHRSILAYPLKRLGGMEFLINLAQPFLGVYIVLNTLFLFICKFACDALLRLANTLKFLLYALSGGPKGDWGEILHTRKQYLGKAFLEPFKLVFNYFNLYALGWTVGGIGVTLFTVLTWPIIFAPRILTTLFWPTTASERLIYARDANSEGLDKVISDPKKHRELSTKLENETREKLSSKEEKLAYEFHLWADENNHQNKPYVDNFKQLINQGVNIKGAQELYRKSYSNSKRDFLHEFLCAASRRGDIELAEMLLNEGVKIDAKSIWGTGKWMITVHTAVIYKQIEFLKWLINDKNIPVNVVAESSVSLGEIWNSDCPSNIGTGRDSIVTSSKVGLMFHGLKFLDVDFVEFLLEKDIDLFAKDLDAERFPYHPLDVLVARYNEAFVYEHSSSDLQKFLDQEKVCSKQKPIDPNHIKQKVNAIFDLIVKHVLAKDELKTQDNLDRMLHCAASIGHLEKVKELVKAGANVNATKLDCTAAKGSHSNVTHKDNNVISLVPAIYIACARGHKDVVDYLLAQEKIDINKPAIWCNFADPKDKRDTGIRGSLLHVACRSGDVELVKVLLNDDPFKEKIVDSLLIPNDQGEIPLMSVYLYSRIYPSFKTILTMLVNAYAEHKLIDWTIPGKNTLIQTACTFGDSAMVGVLLENGADPQQLEAETGATLLHLVTKRQDKPKQRIEIINNLVEKGTDINKGDGEGKTVLLDACNRGDFAVAECLLEKGADPTKVATEHYQYEKGNYGGSHQRIHDRHNSVYPKPVTKTEKRETTPLHFMYHYICRLDTKQYEKQSGLLFKMIKKAKNLDVYTKNKGALLSDVIWRSITDKPFNLPDKEWIARNQAVRDKLLECGANVLAVGQGDRRPLDAACHKWDAVVIKHWLENVDTLYVVGEDQKQEDVEQQKQKDLDMVLIAAKGKDNVDNDLVERLGNAGGKDGRVQENVVQPPPSNQFNAGQDNNNNFVN